MLEGQMLAEDEKAGSSLSIMGMVITCKSNISSQGLLGGAVANTPSFQCRGPGFSQWSGN